MLNVEAVSPLIPVSGREVGVVDGGQEQNDEKLSGTPRSVL